MKEYECLACGLVQKSRRWEVGRECKDGDGFLIRVEKEEVDEKVYNKVWKENQNQDQSE